MLSTKVYTCLGFENRMKLISELMRYMNVYKSLIHQYVLLWHKPLEQDIQMASENDNLSDNYGSHENAKLALKGLDIKEDDMEFVNESLNTKSQARNMLLRRIPQHMLVKANHHNYWMKICLVMWNILLVYLYLTSNIIIGDFNQ